MQFSKENCKILHLDRNNTRYQYTLISNFAEKNLGVLVNTEVNMSHQFVPVAKKANTIFVSVRQRITSRSKKVILSW